MNDTLGRLHFWGSLIGMNGIFLPMFIQGLAGVNRRLYDGGRSYYAVRRASTDRSAGRRGRRCSSAWCSSFFIVNLVWSLARGRAHGGRIRGRRRRSSGRRRRRRRTTTSRRRRSCIAGPYDYSVPGAAADFLPQTQPMIPYTVERRADTGVTNVTMGIWLFLASEVMLFGALFSAYALLRVSAPAWPVGPRRARACRMGATNTLVLAG